MSEVVFERENSVVIGGAMPYDGRLPFQQASVVLASFAAPGGTMVVERWEEDGERASGRSISAEEWWRTMMDGQGVNVRPVPAPPHARVWALRSHFPFHQLALDEANASGCVVHTQPELQSAYPTTTTSTLLLVNGALGEAVLEVWRGRVERLGIEAGRMGEWEKPVNSPGSTSRSAAATSSPSAASPSRA